MLKNKPLLNPDFCVVGGGSAGLSFAAGAAQMGAHVVLIERGAMGGDCLNKGCVPSKALIEAAKFGRYPQDAEKFGWDMTAQVDFQRVYDHIQGVIAAIAPHDSVERFTDLGVQVIQETARFVDPNTLETDSYVIQAKRFILATGSHPFVPPIPGLDRVPYLTNETIFSLNTLPQHLVVIGGGPIGMELAQAFRRFGSQVTVLEMFAALPKDDPEFTTPLKEILIGEGIDLREGVKIDQVTPSLTLEGQDNQGVPFAIQGSHILVATGRRPNLEGLDLDKAGIDHTAMGIRVDQRLRTGNKRVYALGDCIGGYQFTHVAGYHAGLVLRNGIFHLGGRVNTQPLPWVTYTDPELAHVGAQESQLVAQNIRHKVLRLSFKDNDRAQTQRRTEGKIKVLVTPGGKVLGASILGIHGGELIYPWVVAIQNGLKLSALAQSVAPYPTLNDLTKRVAGTFYGEKLFSPRMRRLVCFLLRFNR